MNGAKKAKPVRRLILQKILLCLCFFLYLQAPAQTQDIDERLFEWLESHSREELIGRLEKVRAQYPNSPIPLYLEAYLELDGNKAAMIYQKIAEQFPDSRYAEAAMMKLGEYFFITKSYQRARFWFDKLVKKFSKSKFEPIARFYSGVCSQILNDKKAAEKSFKKFLKKFPEHRFASAARKCLEMIKSGTGETEIPDEPIEAVIEPPKMTEKFTESIYTVQIGAFSKRENAIKLRERLSSLEYSIRIVPSVRKNVTLYLVRVGDFANKSDAENYGNFLKKKYNLPFRIVKKND